jgi:hypothetical protein
MTLTFLRNALRRSLVRRRAKKIAAAFDQVTIDFPEPERAWRYGGGRDLSRLAEDARGSL